MVQIQTLQGGLLTCGIIFLITILFFNTFYTAFFSEPIKFPYINTSNPDERILLSFNITFKSQPCAGLSVEYQDVTGTYLDDI